MGFLGFEIEIISIRLRSFGVRTSADSSIFIQSKSLVHRTNESHSLARSHRNVLMLISKACNGHRISVSSPYYIYIPVRRPGQIPNLRFTKIYKLNFDRMDWVCVSFSLYQNKFKWDSTIFFFFGCMSLQRKITIMPESMHTIDYQTLYGQGLNDGLLAPKFHSIRRMKYGKGTMAWPNIIDWQIQCVIFN